MSKKKKTKERESALNKILKSIIWAGAYLSLLVPLIINTEAFFPMNAPRAFYFMAMVQVMFFAWLLLAFYNSKYRPKFNLILISITLFLIVLTLSTVIGADPLESFWSNYERTSGLLMNFHIFAFFLVLVSFIKTKEEWLRFLGFGAIVAVLVSLIGIADNYGIIQLGAHHRRGSTLGSTSFMGSYLLVAAFLSFYVWLKSKRNWKVFYGIIFTLISAGVLLNPGGRAMKGALLMGMILFFLLYLAFVHSQKSIRVIAKGILFLGMISSIIVAGMVFTEGSFLRNRAMEVRGVPDRFLVWEKAWAGFQERPLLGWGIENFDIVFENNFSPKNLLPRYGGGEWYDRAHNVVFDSLVTTGIVGTLSFFSIFGIAIFLLWKEFLKKKRINFLAPAIFTSLFVAHFVQGLTVFDMISSYMLIFLSLAFVSFLINQNDSMREKDSIGEKKIINPLVSIIIGAIFVISFLFFVFIPYRANLNVLTILNTPVGTPERIELYQKAMKTPIGRDALLVSLSMEVIRSDKQDREKEIILAEFYFLKNKLKTAIIREPLGFKKYWVLGKLYNSYFDYYHLENMKMVFHNLVTEAERKELIRKAKENVFVSKEIFIKAIERSPRNQWGYWGFAQTKINHGKIYLLLLEKEKTQEKFKSAFYLTKKAVELEPRHLGSHLKMIRIADEMLKNEELAEKKRGEALGINPLWKNRI